MFRVFGVSTVSVGKVQVTYWWLSHGLIVRVYGAAGKVETLRRLSVCASTTTQSKPSAQTARRADMRVGAIGSLINLSRCGYRFSLIWYRVSLKCASCVEHGP